MFKFWEDGNNFKKILSYSFSDHDIKLYLGDDAKIIEYSELKAYNNIDELLPNDKSYVVILIESKKRSGHWVSLARHGTKLYYFDSYGKGIDEELKLINPFWRKKLQENEKMLLKLVNDSPYDCEYNSVKLQTSKSWDNSCGRFTCFWLLNFLKGQTLDEFLNMVELEVEQRNYQKYHPFEFDMVVINHIKYMPK